ncbi:hypothetical protein QGM71_05090 [Virgibacillus sp. C22-A2]|uniref:Fur-regulated basic protein FbpA n=1 Tax=Virgibacillus tibetensis TaxID=3042313 RepID=A0ABU6KDJ4_9BACI|nr:hypothetical protein [Virgibacillus sp. C22-A2]
MGEQEKYKYMLKKIIDETESHKIQSSEELIKTLINELTHGSVIVNKTTQSQS